MAVRIRLKRTGTRNKACFRVVVMDHKMSRDGKAIEELGFYDPRNKLEQISLERYDYWVANGATPSETVGDIAARAKNGVVLADRQRPASMSKKAKARIEAEAKAKADAEAAEAKAKADAEAKAREEAEAAAKAAAEAAAAPAEEAPAEETPAAEAE